MASPFRVFRKNVKPMLAFFVVMLMLSWVVGDSLFTYFAGSRNPRAAARENARSVAVRWDGGQLTNLQVSDLVARRQILNTLLEQVEIMGTRPAMEAGVEPRPLKVQILRGPTTPQQGVERSVVQSRIFADKARAVGMRVSDEAIVQYLDELGRGNVTRNEMRAILNRMGSRMTIDEVIATLRDEMLARNYINSNQYAFETVTPEQRWRDWLRVNDRVIVEAAAIPVDKFVADVKEPTDAELTAFFDEYKEREASPELVYGSTELPSASPGFKIPRQIDVHFIEANYDSFLAKAEEKVTDEEIAKYYESHKDPMFIKADTGIMEDAASHAPVNNSESSTQDAAKPENVPTAEPSKKEPTTEAPKTEAPKAEEPKAEEPKVEEPKVEERKVEEPKAEEPKAEEPKAEEPKAEEPKAEEPKAEEPKAEEPKAEEPKAEEPKAEEPKAEEPKAEEPKAEEPKAEEPKAEEPKAEEPKAEEPKAEEPKAEEPKAEGTAPVSPPEPPKDEQTPADEPKSEASSGSSEGRTQNGENSEDGKQSLRSGSRVFRLAAFQEPPKSEAPAAAAPANEPAKSADAPSTPPPAAAPPSVSPEAPASPPAADKESSPPPAVPGGATATPAAKKPVEYQPLEEVKDQIRREIASGRVAEELTKITADIEGTLDADFTKYFGELLNAEADKKQAPEPPKSLTDLAPLAEKYGLKSGKTGPASLLQLRELPIGKSSVAETGRSTLAMLFATKDLDLYQPFSTVDIDGNRYIAMKTSDTPAKVPTLAEVREEVVKAWKFQEAAKLAEKAASEMAKKAQDAKTPLPQVFADDPSIKVVRTDPFSELTGGDVSFASGRLQQTPFRLGQPDGIVAPGPDFMKQVFQLNDGEVGAVLNHDHTIAYVVRPVEHQMPLAELRTAYLGEANNWPGIVNMTRGHMQEAWNSVQEDILAGSSLKWERAPDKVDQGESADAG